MRKAVLFAATAFVGTVIIRVLSKKGKRKKNRSSSRDARFPSPTAESLPAGHRPNLLSPTGSSAGAGAGAAEGGGGAAVVRVADGGGARWEEAGGALVLAISPLAAVVTAWTLSAYMWKVSSEMHAGVAVTAGTVVAGGLLHVGLSKAGEPSSLFLPLLGMGIMGTAGIVCFRVLVQRLPPGAIVLGGSIPLLPVLFVVLTLAHGVLRWLLRQLAPGQQRASRGTNAAPAAGPAARVEVTSEDVERVAALVTGRWRRDRERSDSFEEVFDLVHASFLVRKAVRLIVGADMHFDEECFRIAVTSVIPWFKIREHYPLTGEPWRHKRRDLRRGQHTGWVEVLVARGPEGVDGIALNLQWPDPHAGRERSVYSVLETGELQMRTRTEVGGKVVNRTEIYVRQ